MEKHVKMNESHDSKGIEIKTQILKQKGKMTLIYFMFIEKNKRNRGVKKRLSVLNSLITFVKVSLDY